MSLAEHRLKENLGGVVLLLTIDASVVTGNPLHIKRYTNNYGENGTGVWYQGNQFSPYAYRLKTVSRNTQSSSQGATIELTDPDYEFTRFIDEVGGSLENARVYEYKVYERFLDSGSASDINAYVKRMDHLVSHVSTESSGREIQLTTTDPLSREILVPVNKFSAGIPNNQASHLNVFPAVSRAITEGR